jgi:enoyl-CoA hydratase
VSDAQTPLIVSVENGVAEVTLNRPDKLNALNPELVVRLARCWDEISADESLRVIILTGAGDRAFSAGADLGRLTPLLMRARPAEDEWDEALLAEPTLLNKAMLRTNEFFIPVIGALKGKIVGGGMELALGCDLRVVASDSELGLVEVRRGLIPAAGGIARVSRQVAWAQAAEILMLGERISAADALAMGLVNRVVESDQVLSTARELAGLMANNGPLAMRKVKEAMLRASGRSIEEAFGVEDDCIKVILRSKDAREGSKAFLEKRKPEFTGS